MANVLWLLDRNIEGNPNYGETPLYHNLILTHAKECPQDRVNFLYYDESAYCYGRHIDEVLYQYCKIYKIDLVYLVFQGQSRINPSLSKLSELKSLGVKIVCFWPDSNPLDLVLREKCAGIINLHVGLDGCLLAPQDDILYLWTPESRFLFYPDNQDIEASFIGSLRYKQRADYIDQIKQKIPDFSVAAGQRETSMSHEAYASLIRRSKINVNFSINPMGQSYFQVKGRVFEALASETCLFEEKNEATRRFFEPGNHYVEFEGAEDLVEKIQFYRDNPEKRQEIARSGYHKYINYYTAGHFWSKVMEKLNQ